MFNDHFFLSDHIYGDVELCSALDSGLNFSDHLPLELHINIAHIQRLPIVQCRQHLQRMTKRLRWDKADLLSYYYTTNRYLAGVNTTVISSLCACPAGCQCDAGKFIDVMYGEIVNSLHCAATDHCPQTSDAVFKSYWDEEMNTLKSNSINTHQLWVACGRPVSGPVYLSRCRARAEYRRALKCKRRIADSRIFNDLHEHLLSKDSMSFWKTWKRKVNNSKNVAADTVDGFVEPHGIAGIFAEKN